MTTEQCVSLFILYMIVTQKVQQFSDGKWTQYLIN